MPNVCSRISAPDRSPRATIRRLWLRHALATIGAVNVRHPGNHRFCLTLGGRRYAGQLALAPDGLGPPRAAYQPELGPFDGLIA